MDSAARAQMARLDVLQALTLPEERLWLSYPLADMAGSVQRPASVCAQIRRIFPALQVEGGATGEALGFDASPRAALDALGPALREAFDADRAPNHPALSALAWLQAQPDWKASLDNVLAGISARVETDAALEPSPGPVNLRCTVSRLETFAGCPYRHFVTYGLQPRPMEPYGLQPNALGTLYHAAIEAFTRLAVDAPGWPDLSRERCEAIMDAALQPLLEKERLGPLGEDAQAEAIARRVRSTAHRAAWVLTEQLRAGVFLPARIETDFGEAGLALPVEGGGQLILHGRIDRVDAWHSQGETFLRVVDYKSGHSTPSLEGARLYHGLQQQLPIYLAAALGSQPGASPAGMYYFRVDDPLIATRERNPEVIEGQIAKELRMKGVALEDADIAKAQGRGDLLNKDGSFGKSAAVASPERMRRLLKHAQGKATQFARRIGDGDIGVSPARLGAWRSCQYCDYHAICGIDPLLPGGSPRLLEPMTMAELHALLEREQGKERDS
jgi:ATP-dependent helicase/nuclease subunit B